MTEFVLKFLEFLENSNFTYNEKEIMKIILNNFLDQQKELEEKIFHDNEN